MSTAQSDLSRAADLALALGWALTPLRGKRPQLKGWQERPVASEEEVFGWIDEGYNLGVRTGSVSGIVVLDDDTGTQAGAKYFGLDKIETVTAETSPGKRHYYFALPEGVTIGNSVGKLFSMLDPSGALDARGRPKMVGLDVRGDGGQVVLTGSIHPDSGRPYRWLDDHGPHEVPVAELPANVLKAIQDKSARPKRGTSARTNRPKGARPSVDVEVENLTEAQRQRVAPYVDAIVAGELEKLRDAAEGTRNSTLNNVSLRLGHLAGAGLIDEDEIAEQLAVLAEEIGLEPGEIEPTIRSGMSAGIDRPEDVPALLTRLEKQDADVLAEFGNFLRGERTANRTMPDDTEADELTTAVGGNGRRIDSARKKAAGKVIKKADLAAYAACFEAGGLPGAEGTSQTEQLTLLRTKVVEPVVAALVPDSQFDPRLVYALTYKLTKDFGAPGWRESVWQAVLDAWDAAEAELDALRVEHERAEQERAEQRGSLVETILAGLAESFPDERVPDDPEARTDWMMEHLALVDPRGRVYLVDRDGRFPEEPNSRSGLASRIKKTGLEPLVALEEIRGKTAHRLTGAEIVTNLQPSDVASVTYDLDLEFPSATLVGDQYRLALPLHPLADLKPLWSDEIDDYFRFTYGEDYDDLMRCLASVPEVRRRMVTIVVEGPNSVGKGMLGLGIAGVFRHGHPNSARAFDRFNSGLVRTPVIVCEEGLPKGAYQGSVAQRIRSLIGGGSEEIEGKGIEKIELEINPRVLICTNDLQREVVRPLLGEDGLNRASQDAVGIRLATFKIREEAKGYLAERGHERLTGRWIKDRLLARHILALHERLIESEIARGNRFLGEPEAREDLFADSALGDKLVRLFVEAVCRMFEKGTGPKHVIVPRGGTPAAGLYFEQAAFEQMFGNGILPDFSKLPDPSRIEETAVNAALLPDPKGRGGFHVTGGGTRKWRVLDPKSLAAVHGLAEEWGLDRRALAAFLVEHGELDAADYGTGQQSNGRTSPERPTAITDRVKSRMGGNQ
ncbi:MAG: bifunctional DNA primase/polymerase [Planctomycetota bacterium]